jgi:UDP-glucose 4-epimerase
MKIAVTGGAGFIGSNIVDAYIAAGHDVVVLDNFSSGKHENVNPKARVYTVDIASPEIHEIFANERFEMVNHHAAQISVRVSVDDPAADAQVNILGSLNVFEAARKSGVRKIIFASSGGAIYGEQRVFPADEMHTKRPLSPYGVTKLSVEKYLGYYFLVYGIEHVIFRYTNVYGPRQSAHGEAGVVAIFAEKMLCGDQPVINGSGKQTRDYVYIQDVVRANILALNKNAKGVYNVCTNHEYSVNTIFTYLRMITNSRCAQTHAPAKAGEQMRSICSYRKIAANLGWTPKTSIEDGLAKTVTWFKRQHGITTGDADANASANASANSSANADSTTSTNGKHTTLSNVAVNTSASASAPLPQRTLLDAVMNAATPPLGSTSGSSSSTASEADQPKRGRGRPRKAPVIIPIEIPS